MPSHRTSPAKERPAPYTLPPKPALSPHADAAQGKGRARKPKPVLAEPQPQRPMPPLTFEHWRPPTPVPVLGRQGQGLAPPTYPSLPQPQAQYVQPPLPLPEAEPPHAPPTVALPLPPHGFLHALPRAMLPHSQSPIWLAPNGLFRYYAYAGADGVAQVALMGPVGALQDLYQDLCTRVPDPQGIYDFGWG